MSHAAAVKRELDRATRLRDLTVSEGSVGWATVISIIIEVLKVLAGLIERIDRIDPQ